MEDLNMRNNTIWSWKEGTVDNGNEHFQIRYRGDHEVDSQRESWEIVALVGTPAM